jgi:hypothetical protein
MVFFDRIQSPLLRKAEDKRSAYDNGRFDERGVLPAIPRFVYLLRFFLPALGEALLEGDLARVRDRDFPCRVLGGRANFFFRVSQYAAHQLCDLLPREYGSLPEKRIDFDPR